MTTVVRDKPVLLNDTSIRVVNSSLFEMSAGLFLELEDEIILVTDVKGESETVVELQAVRGLAGTYPREHAAGSIVRPTSGARLTADASPMDDRLAISSVFDLPNVEVGGYLQVGAEVVRVEEVGTEYLIVSRDKQLNLTSGSMLLVISSSYIRMNYVFGDSSLVLKVWSWQEARIAEGMAVQVDDEILLVETIVDDTSAVVRRGYANSSVNIHGFSSSVFKVMAIDQEYIFSFPLQNPTDLNESLVITLEAKGTWNFTNNMSSDASSIVYSYSCLSDWIPCNVTLEQQLKDTQLSLPMSSFVLMENLELNSTFALVAIDVKSNAAKVGEYFQIDDEIVKIDSINMVSDVQFNISLSRGSFQSSVSRHSFLSQFHSCKMALLEFDFLDDYMNECIVVEQEYMIPIARTEEFILVKRGFRSSQIRVHPSQSLVSLCFTDLIVDAPPSLSFFTPGRFVQVDGEVLKIQSTASNRLTVLRACLNTTISTHLSGSIVFLVAAGFEYGDSFPLKVKAPGFVIREIGQSNPFQGTTNQLTVTFVPNVNLSGDMNTIIMISGIKSNYPCGSINVWTNTCGLKRCVTLQGATSLFGPKGVWSSSQSSLELTMLSGQVWYKDTAVIFGFQFPNPTSVAGINCPPADIKVSISTQDGQFFQSYMTYGATWSPAMGLKPEDSAPLQILPCTADDCTILANIGQNTYLPSIENTITVTLSFRTQYSTGNCASANAITISGLTGATTDATGILQSDGSILQYRTYLQANIGSNQISDTQVPVLDLPYVVLQVGQYIRIDLEIMRIVSYDSNNDGVIGDLMVERSQMNTGAAPHYKDAPVDVILPVFDGYKCASWSIDGLNCYQWQSISLCPNGVWDRSSGTLIVRIANTFQGGDAFKFSFKLLNPNDEQQSPTIRIKATNIYSSSEIRISSANRDITSLLRLPGSEFGFSAPLYCSGQKLLQAKIGQSSYLPNAVNVLTVTLSSSVSIGGGAMSAFILSGLRGLSMVETQTDVELESVIILQGYVKTYVTATTFELYHYIESYSHVYTGYSLQVCCDQAGLDQTRKIISHNSYHVLEIDSPYSINLLFPIAFKIISEASDVLSTSAYSWNATLGVMVFKTDASQLSFLSAGNSLAFQFRMKNPSYGRNSTSITVEVSNAYICIGGLAYGISCTSLEDEQTCSFGGGCVAVEINPTILGFDPYQLPYETILILESELYGTFDTVITFNVSNATKLLTYQTIQLGKELLKILTINGNTISVSRYQDDSIFSVHVKGSTIYVIQPGASKGDVAPLYIRCPGFAAVELTMNSSTASAPTQLSLFFVRSTLLPAGTRVALSNLPVQLQTEISVLKLEGHGVNNFVSNVNGNSATALWSEKEKTLTMYVVEDIDPGTIVVLTFHAFNGIYSRLVEDVKVLIESLGESHTARLLVSGRSGGIIQGLSPSILPQNWTSSSFGCVVLRNLLSDNEFNIFNPLLEKELSVSELMPYIATNITLTIRVAVTVSDDRGVYFTISGLNGMLTPSTGGISYLLHQFLQNDTSFRVNSASRARISVGCFVRIESEFLEVRRIEEDVVIHVSRGQYGTTISDHPSATEVEVMLPIFTVKNNTQSIATSANNWNQESGTLVIGPQEIGHISKSVNNVETTFAVNLYDPDTILSGRYFQMESEIFQVLNHSSSVLTVARGLYVTCNAYHDAGSRIRIAIVPDVLYEISFPMVQGASFSTISSQLSVTLEYPYEYLPRIDGEAKLGFQGSKPGDAAPLRIVSAGFTVLSASQTNPYPNASNWIKVIFGLSIDINSTRSSIRISGLNSSQSSDENVILVDPVPYPIQTGEFGPLAGTVNSFYLKISYTSLDGCLVSIKFHQEVIWREIVRHDSNFTAFLNESIYFQNDTKVSYTIWTVIPSLSMSASMTHGAVILEWNGTLHRGLPYSFAFQIQNPITELSAGEVQLFCEVITDSIHIQKEIISDETAILFTSQSILDDDVPSNSLFQKCECLNSKCCIRYSRISLSSIENILIGNSIQIGDEKMTVIEIDDQFLLVSRGPRLLFHPRGSIVYVLRIGPSRGLVVGYLNLQSQLLGEDEIIFSVKLSYQLSKGQLLLINDEVIRVISSNTSLIEVDRGAAGSLPAVHLNTSTIQFPSVSGLLFAEDSKPLRVYKPEFFLRNIGQSNPSPGSKNNLYLTLAANIQLDSDCQIAVTNLAALNLSSRNLTLYDFDEGTFGVFDSQLSLSSERIVIKIANGAVMQSGKPYKFFFQVINNVESVDWVAPGIFANCSRFQIEENVMNSDYISIPNIVGGNRGDARPFYISSPTFVLREISQSTSTIGDAAIIKMYVILIFETGEKNEIYVTLAPNINIPGGSHIIFNGLQGVILEEATRINETKVTVTSGTFATLNQTAIQLLATDQEDDYYIGCEILVFTESVESRYVVAFKSGIVFVDSPLLTSQSNGSFVIQSKILSEIEAIAHWNESEGSLTIVIQADGRMRSNMTYSFAFQVTNGLREQEALSINVSVDGDISINSGLMQSAAGGILNLTILDHGQDFSNSPLLFMGNTTSCLCGDRAFDQPGNGRYCLKPVVANGASFNFTRAYGARILAIRASGALLRPNLPKSIIPPTVLEPDLNTIPTVANAIPQPQLGDAAPLKVYGAEFVVSSIGQSTPYPAATNTITVTLCANLLLTSLAIITIEGLSGGSAATGGLALEGLGAVSFQNSANGIPRTADWNNNRKSLNLFVIFNVSTFATQVFSFKLQNSISGQSSPPISISASGITGGVYPAPTQILRRAMTKDLATTLSDILGALPGDAAPLKIQAPKFLVKRVSQSYAWPCRDCGVQNYIYVTLAVNFVASGLTNSEIIISGLRGSATPDSGGNSFLMSDLEAEATEMLVDDSSSSLTSREGSRLYIQGQPIIDDWFSTSILVSGTTYLNPGIHDISLEYKEVTGLAKIRLKWKTSTGDFSPVPKADMYYGKAVIGNEIILYACGDGLITVALEDCDDGNTDSEDGCSNKCSVEHGYSCNGTPSFCETICGDGRRISAENGGREECDDGNLVDGDGCSSACTIESNYTCSGGTPMSRDYCKVLSTQYEPYMESVFLDYVSVNISSLTRASNLQIQFLPSQIFFPTASNSVTLTVQRNSSILRSFAERTGMLRSDLSSIDFRLKVGGSIVFESMKLNLTTFALQMFHCYNVTRTAVQKDVAIGSVAPDSSPLNLKGLGFIENSISQSTSSVASINLLRVSIALNIDVPLVSDSCRLTISGLKGTDSPSMHGFTSILPIDKYLKILKTGDSQMFSSPGVGIIRIDQELMHFEAKQDLLNVQRGYLRSHQMSHEDVSNVILEDLAFIQQGLNESDTTSLVESAIFANIQLSDILKIDLEYVFLEDLEIRFQICPNGCEKVEDLRCQCYTTRYDRLTFQRGVGNSLPSSHNNFAVIHRMHIDYIVNDAASSTDTVLNLRKRKPTIQEFSLYQKYIQMGTEILLVNAVTFPTVIVQRGAVGTKPLAVSSGTLVEFPRQ
eukprot:764445-Hanusia_phi.AAC.1